MFQLMIECQYQAIALICMILGYKIIPTQCKIHGIFKFFSEKSCTVPQTCFVSLTIADHCWPLLTILTHCLSRGISYFTCLYYMTLHLTWWHFTMTRKKWHICISKRRPCLRQIGYFDSVSGPNGSTCLRSTWIFDYILYDDRVLPVNKSEINV